MGKCQMVRVFFGLMCLAFMLRRFVMELQKTAPLASEGTTKSKEKEE